MVSITEMLEFRDELSRIVEKKHLSLDLTDEMEKKFVIMKSLVTSYQRLLHFGINKLKFEDIHNTKTKPELEKSNNLPSSSSLQPSNYPVNYYNPTTFQQKIVTQSAEEKSLLARSVERTLEQYDIIKLNKWVKIIEEDTIEYESSSLLEC